MSTAPSPDTDTLGQRFGLTDPDTAQLYTAAQATAEHIATVLSDEVVKPLAKEAFATDTGTELNQVLPGNHDEYDYTSAHGFEALVLPEERKVTNQAYRGKAITGNRVMRDHERFDDIIDQAETAWNDEYGEYKKGISQIGHPGPCPVVEQELDEAFESVRAVYEALVDSKDLNVVIAAARAENTPVLSDMFGTTEGDILTPGGTDLSALPRTDDIHVPYNDGTIAVLRPTSEDTSLNTPTRGVIIGHDDTEEPVGMFAHVIDVTNLHPQQETTHEAIRDAMGFDSELDPWNPVDRLDIGPDERIRLQGDLRVERVGDVDGFPEELRRNSMQEAYETQLDAIVGGIQVPSTYLRGRWEDLSVTSVVDVAVSHEGTVTLNPDTDDPNVELLAYATMLCEMSVGKADAYEDYPDVPFIHHPRRVTDSIAAGSLSQALTTVRGEVRSVLETALDRHEDEVESMGRELAAEAKASLTAPQQVNLPVDNHMTFIESGYAPEVDTEPVPVAVPEETTLHIVHGEHNSVTVQVDPGVYRFSLLPRGLQPREDRPQWPRP